jgi:alpha-D-xyloside xylohydrolase
MKHFRQEENSLTWEQYHETVRIEPWGPDSLRVRATVAAEVLEDLPGGLLDPISAKAQIEIGEERAVIRNGAIAAQVRPGGDGVEAGIQAAIRFFNNTTGTELLAESPSHFPRPPARQFMPVGGDLFHVQARFKAYDDERIYGLGQHQHGLLDQKGAVIDLVQYNSEVCIPFLLSSRGYGFLWNNPAVGRVELGQAQTRWIAEATPQMDYWITASDTLAEIMSHYADATGHVPLLPEWAAGFWQCKLRYRTQEELLSVAREHKRRGLPLSVIVVDFFHWTMQGEWQFDPQCWPDPAGMVRELEEMGIRVMVSIWPTVNPASANFDEMQRRGLLLRTERGVPAIMLFTDTGFEGPVYMHYYDPTHPEARRFIWERVREGYYPARD